MKYRFTAVVTRINVGTKRAKDEADEVVQVPCFTLTLQAAHPNAATGAARLTPFIGEEVEVELEGQGGAVSITELPRFGSN